jgi:hypothetical protein
MYDNYLQIIRIFQDDFITKLGHSSTFLSSKELFDKNNQTLLEYFKDCIEVVDAKKNEIFELLQKGGHNNQEFIPKVESNFNPLVMGGQCFDNQIIGHINGISGIIKKICKIWKGAFTNLKLCNDSQLEAIIKCKGYINELLLANSSRTTSFSKPVVSFRDKGGKGSLDPIMDRIDSINETRSAISKNVKKLEQECNSFFDEAKVLFREMKACQKTNKLLEGSNNNLIMPTIPVNQPYRHLTSSHFGPQISARAYSKSPLRHTTIEEAKAKLGRSCSMIKMSGLGLAKNAKSFKRIQDFDKSECYEPHFGATDGFKGSSGQSFKSIINLTPIRASNYSANIKPYTSDINDQDNLSVDKFISNQSPIKRRLMSTTNKLLRSEIKLCELIVNFIGQIQNLQESISKKLPSVPELKKKFQLTQQDLLKLVNEVRNKYENDLTNLSHKNSEGSNSEDYQFVIQTLKYDVQELKDKLEKQISKYQNLNQELESEKKKTVLIEETFKKEKLSIEEKLNTELMRFKELEEKYENIMADNNTFDEYSRLKSEKEHLELSNEKLKSAIKGLKDQVYALINEKESLQKKVENGIINLGSPEKDTRNNRLQKFVDENINLKEENQRLADLLENAKETEEKLSLITETCEGIINEYQKFREDTVNELNELKVKLEQGNQVGFTKEMIIEDLNNEIQLLKTELRVKEENDITNNNQHSFVSFLPTQRAHYNYLIDNHFFEVEAIYNTKNLLETKDNVYISQINKLEYNYTNDIDNIKKELQERLETLNIEIEKEREYVKLLSTEKESQELKIQLLSSDKEKQIKEIEVLKADVQLKVNCLTSAEKLNEQLKGEIAMLTYEKEEYKNLYMNRSTVTDKNEDNNQPEASQVIDKKELALLNERYTQLKDEYTKIFEENKAQAFILNEKDLLLAEILGEKKEKETELEAMKNKLVEVDRLKDENQRLNVDYKQFKDSTNEQLGNIVEKIRISKDSKFNSGKLNDQNKINIIAEYIDHQTVKLKEFSNNILSNNYEKKNLEDQIQNLITEYNQNSEEKKKQCNLAKEALSKLISAIIDIIRVRIPALLDASDYNFELKEDFSDVNKYITFLSKYDSEINEFYKKMESKADKIKTYKEKAKKLKEQVHELKNKQQIITLQPVKSIEFNAEDITPNKYKIITEKCYEDLKWVLFALNDCQNLNYENTKWIPHNTVKNYKDFASVVLDTEPGREANKELEQLITKLASKEEEISNLKMERDLLRNNKIPNPDDDNKIPFEKYEKLLNQLVEEQGKTKLLKSTVDRLKLENEMFKNVIERSK